MKNILFLFGIILALNLYGIAPVFAEETQIEDDILNSNEIGTLEPGAEEDVNIYEKTATVIENNNKKQN